MAMKKSRVSSQMTTRKSKTTAAVSQTYRSVMTEAVKKRRVTARTFLVTYLMNRIIQACVKEPKTTSVGFS